MTRIVVRSGMSNTLRQVALTTRSLSRPRLLIEPFKLLFMINKPYEKSLKILSPNHNNLLNDMVHFIHTQSYQLNTQTAAKETVSHIVSQIDFFVFGFFRGPFSKNFISMSRLFKLRDRYFYDGHWVQHNGSGYYYCHTMSCPFCVKCSIQNENSEELPTVEKVLFPLHCHALPSYSRKANKDLILHELDVIKRGGPESRDFQE